MERITINFLIFFMLSYFILKLSLPKFKEWLLEHPNFRSLHKEPTPSGGGIVFVLIGTLGAYYFKFLLPLICLPLSIIGLIDDRINLSNKLRYFFQVITVIFLINICPLKIETSNYFLDSILNLILIIFLTAIINFVNFMDGIDGLVAGSMIIYLLIFVNILTPALIPLIASLFAFLIFNWHPAKVFMGDTGSTYLGVLFAGLLLEMPSWNISLEILLVASPLLADAFFCIIRRILSSENIFKPHRKHLYQRLIGNRGLTHSKVSSIYIFASFSLAMSKYLGGLNLIIVSLAIVLFVGYYLDRKIATPFQES